MRKLIALAVLSASVACGRTIPVIITWENDPQTTATISWERETAGRGTVQYGTTTNYTHTVSDWGGTKRHRIQLEDLEPDTVYHYKVSSTDGYSKGDHTFKTAPTTTGSLHFVVHGDLQGGITWSAAREVAVAITNEDPELVIHVGDLANVDYDEHPYASWQDFFGACTDELEKVVFMPVPGNHDDAPRPNSEYWKIFHTPQKPSNGSYYSFDVANIHFVALNSDVDLEGQTNWLMRDLQGAAHDPDIDWIIPYWHRPPYSLGERGGDDNAKTNFCRPLVYYEADVVFSGHSHNYQRWVPIRGVQYFVAGGGGGRLYTSSFTPGSHEFATTCYHYVRGNMTGDVMHLQAIRSDGLLFDEVVYTNVGRAVQVSPAFPIRGDTVTISYDPSQGTLSGVSPIYLHLGLDDFSSAPVSSQMTYNAGTGRWEYDYVVPQAATTRLAFVFRDSTSSTWDNNYTYNWQVLLDRAEITPELPAAESLVTVEYHADMGPLAGSGQIYMHLGFDAWEEEATGLAMTNISGDLWRYAYPLPDWAEEMEVIFGNGSSIDDNYGMQWNCVVTNAAGEEPLDPLPMVVEGTPVISTNPPTIQNIVGDNFDFDMSGGVADSLGGLYGFGDFGQIYFNYDSSNLYVGGINSDLGGSNNVHVLFLGLDTLTDNASNLWHKTSTTPQALRYMHNVSFSEPMDIAIVFGDEYGDDPDDFNFSYPLPTWYDFGQGIFYIGTNSTSYSVVTDSRLSQFDGTGTTACTSTDDDSDRRTDRWEASLPWSSLGAGSVDDVDALLVAGVIGSSTTNYNYRYLSATYIGERTYGARHSRGNPGLEVMVLEPTQILLGHGDVDNDGLPNLWEHENFGAADGPHAGDDSDGDDFSNWGEYVADTEPTNSDSFFVFQSATSMNTGESFVVTWPYADGRTYDLYRTTNDFASYDHIATNLTVGVYTDTVSGVERANYKVQVSY